MGNNLVSDARESCEIENVAEELAAVEAVAPERHVHAREGLHAVLIRDIRVVTEDCRNWNLCHLRNKAQVRVLPHVVGGQRRVTAAAAAAMGGGGKDPEQEYSDKELHRNCVEWVAHIAEDLKNKSSLYFDGKNQMIQSFKSAAVRVDLTCCTELPSFFYFVSLILVFFLLLFITYFWGLLENF